MFLGMEGRLGRRMLCRMKGLKVLADGGVEFYYVEAHKVVLVLVLDVL